MQLAQAKAEIAQHLMAMDKLYEKLLPAAYHTPGSVDGLRMVTACVGCAAGHLRDANESLGKLLVAQLTDADREQAKQAEVRS